MILFVVLPSGFRQVFVMKHSLKNLKDVEERSLHMIRGAADYVSSCLVIVLLFASFFICSILDVQCFLFASCIHSFSFSVCPFMVSFLWVPLLYQSAVYGAIFRCVRISRILILVMRSCIGGGPI